MKKVIIAAGVAVMAFASVASAQGYSFSSNLTVGSTGPDVVALQTWLMANGFGIPSVSSGAAAKGYFGAQTQSAVKKYQAAHGLPSTGFFGPLTRAALNGGAVATGGASCPAGYVCTPTGGSTGTVGGMTGGITTPGVPGIMSVTSGPLSSAVLHVGDQNVAIQTVRVQAQYSDLDVQSLTLDLGNNTAFYNKLVNTISVTDGTNILASQPVNSSTVVQSGSEYVLGIAGFHVIVPKGTYKDITIKASLNSSIDSTYTGAGSKVPVQTNGLWTGWGVAVVANGLRAVDGAGLNLYGPTTAVAQAFTVNASTVDNAQANLSLDPSSPLVASVPVSDTTNGQYLGLPVFSFDVNAQNDSLHLRTVNVGIVNTGAAGSVGAAYLFQGSTQIASASVVNGVASFANISNGTAGASIPVNTTVAYTVKVDVTGLTGSGSAIITASTTGTQTILSSNDSTATISGSATGNAQTVAPSGPLFTLVGSPTIVKNAQTTGAGTDVTYVYTATFNINVQAVGQNVIIGLPASTTAAGASFGTSTTGKNIAALYENQAASTTGPVGGLKASWAQPTNTALNASGADFTLARNQSVTIPVTYSFSVINPTSNVEAVQLQGIYTNGSVLTNFMANQPAWRTASI